MSIGADGKCKKIYETDKEVAYEYGRVNGKMDGLFVIDKQAFSEPYILDKERIINKTKKIKRYKEFGKKSYEELISIVEECSDEFYSAGRKLIFMVMDHYVETGEISDSESFCC